jgi:hypothetical protein
MLSKQTAGAVFFWEKHAGDNTDIISLCGRETKDGAGIII